MKYAKIALVLPAVASFQFSLPEFIQPRFLSQATEQPAEVVVVSDTTISDTPIPDTPIPDTPIPDTPIPDTPGISDVPDIPNIPETPRLAIVGAGAAGSSAAFWISKAKERFGLDIDIDVYERNDYIGGRM